jgi:hypothetical protein
MEELCGGIDWQRFDAAMQCKYCMHMHVHVTIYCHGCPKKDDKFINSSSAN